MNNNEHIFKELGGGKSIFYAWSEVMHTRMDVILCHRLKEACEAAFDGMMAELRRIESLINRFDPASEIARINALAAHQPVTVSTETMNILSAAFRWGAMTDHHFDITYASAKGDPESRVYLDKSKNQVLFKVKGVVLDLGGYGKGYALQQIREKMQEEGWTDYLLNFGNSTVCARGNRPGGKGWLIGIENQSRPGSNALEINLLNQSLNTSGNTGQHTRHIYASQRGDYIGGLSSVSVVTDDPLEGEVLSTAFFSALEGVKGATPSFLKHFPAAKIYTVDYHTGTHTVGIIG